MSAGGRAACVPEKVDGSDLAESQGGLLPGSACAAESKCVQPFRIPNPACILTLECGCQNNLKMTVRRKHSQGAGPP